jgi:hypothetical protein
MKIVHLSASALAGAPGMLAAAQQRLGGHEAVHLRCGDYGRARDRVFAGSLAIAPTPSDRAIFNDRLTDADLIHVHNLLPAFALEWLAELGLPGRRPFVYQVHSPLGEAPLWTDVSDQMGLDFALKLVCAQHQPRLYPDYRPVPLCVFRSGLDERARPWERPGRVPLLLFTPSGAGRGRWGRKSTPAFETQLRALAAQPWLDIERITDWPPEKVLARRRTAEFGLDEVVTGGFHTVTYETMAGGGVAVNAADSESVAALQMALRTDAAPPFLRTDPLGLGPALRALATQPAALADARRASHQYFWQHMSPRRVVQRFDELYAELA